MVDAKELSLVLTGCHLRMLYPQLFFEALTLLIWLLSENWLGNHSLIQLFDLQVLVLVLLLFVRCKAG